MRLEGVYVASAASWLPPAMTAEEALSRGLADSALVRSSDMASVTVATESDQTPAEMAARAAQVALERSGHEAADIDLILHASLYDQDHDLWAPASYVQRVAVRNHCPAMEVRQVSNGGMAALELAAGYLQASPLRTAALLTAGDRFDPPAFDRWRSDPGTVYADGGSALVVSTRTGFARLRSLVLESDPDLEGMHRRGNASGPAPPREPARSGLRVDLDACRRNFVQQVGMSFTASRLAVSQTKVVKEALADADIDPDAITCFVLPHFGRRRLNASFSRPLDLDLDRTTWPWSRTVGHLGAGDQFAGLSHLTETDALRPGDVVALLGVGSGFSWSCAVLEILHRPNKK